MDYSPAGSPVSGFSRQEYWSGLPFPPAGGLPDPGIEPVSPALTDASPLVPPQKPYPVDGCAEGLRGAWLTWPPLSLALRIFLLPAGPLLWDHSVPESHLLSVINTYALFRGSMKKVS